MTFRRARSRRKILPWLSGDLAFKVYVLVALLSTSGLDMLLFVTLLLLTLVAAVELSHLVLAVVPVVRPTGSRRATLPGFDGVSVD